MSKPAPRPALQRAADAEVHPVSGRVESVITVEAEVAATAAKKRKKTKGATSDTMRSPKDKDDRRVELRADVPKSLRKKLRKAAASRKVTPDQLLAEILRAALD